MAPAVRILVIDNYDSFTYNLVQAIEALGARCEVVLNDRISVEAARDRRANGVLLSPGPGVPETAGITLPVLGALPARVPILGVCLGHQAIGIHFGARLQRAARIMHGKTSDLEHPGQGLYAGLPAPMPVARYHSLILDEASLPEALTVTAKTREGEVMGIRHRERPIEGIQFHPESFLTPAGPRLLANWLQQIQ